MLVTFHLGDTPYTNGHAYTAVQRLAFPLATAVKRSSVSRPYPVFEDSGKMKKLSRDFHLSVHPIPSSRAGYKINEKAVQASLLSRFSTCGSGCGLGEDV